MALYKRSTLIFLLYLHKIFPTTSFVSFQGTTSIALYPPSGLLCYTAIVTGGKNLAEVNCAWMDGRNKAVLWRKSSIPNSLVFFNKGTMIFWADTGEQFEIASFVT